MNPIVTVLLLVSCNDNLNSCYSNDSMVKFYPTAQICEQDIVPSIKKLTSGQQIFAQCTNIPINSTQQKVSLVWSVTSQGNFLLQSLHNNDNEQTDLKTNAL
ncbi:hypothetical protein [Bartonella schoenbuchensis]|uniref:hypothetical protein n=1 Tax=Bartonella schoenbuchensis TaxID=165694 RepID=UPI00099AEF85|nr:hypothetical protein [Bartonella schoenbuchensis]